MIEWILLALAGTGLSYAGKKESSNRRPSGGLGTARLAESKKTAEQEFRQKVLSWRAQWEQTINRARWVPSGTASRIIARHPAPERPRSWLDTLLNKSSMLDELTAEFEAHNQEHLARQKERLKPFFDTVENNPLTEEQIKACVCMDDCVQIVAAAGSGKTSTMVAKVGYALHERLAEPSQILLLAFNSAAAKELRDRVEERLGSFTNVAEITAKTFHAFGLEVISSATGKKPSLAPWLEHPGQDIEMLVEIIAELSQRDRKFKDDWDEFRTIYGRDIGRWNEPAQPDAFGNGRRGFQTANGEIVKSKEERRLADWVF